MVGDRGRDRVRGSGAMVDGQARDAQQALAQIRIVAAQGRQPRDPWAVVLHVRATGWASDACIRQGSVAATARSPYRQLLDRATTARPGGRIDDPAVLKSVR